MIVFRIRYQTITSYPSVTLALTSPIDVISPYSLRPSESLPAPGTKAQKYTLPSTETPSGSTIGVGSLPGTSSEISVAKLPEERRQEGLPSHETDHEILGKTGGVGPLPGGPNESGVAICPEERRQEGLPSHETDHERLGKTGGVGPLPGGPDESRVALCPEERLHSQCM